MRSCSELLNSRDYASQSGSFVSTEQNAFTVKRLPGGTNPASLAALAHGAASLHLQHFSSELPNHKAAQDMVGRPNSV